MPEPKAQLVDPQGPIDVPGISATGIITATGGFIGAVQGAATGLASTTANLSVGIVTATKFQGNTTGNVSGLADDTNINVGIITSTSFTGDLVGNAAGLSTTTANINAGIMSATSFAGNFTGVASGITGTPNIVVGIMTGTLNGDGSNLTGIAATNWIANNVTANSSTTTVDLSLGNVVKPLDLANEYGSDSLRYYLMRNMVLGQDATFTLDSFIKRYNADLANDYGNVINRVVVLITKYFDSKVPSPGEYNNIDKNLITKFDDISLKISKYIKELKIHELVEFIFSLVRLINKYLEDKEPWKTYKDFPNQNEVTATTLYLSIECIRICSQLLHPIMPSKTEIVLKSMNAMEINFNFGQIKSGQKIDSIPTLFPRIEVK